MGVFLSRQEGHAPWQNLNGTMGLASSSAFCPDWLTESLVKNVSFGPADRDGIFEEEIHSGTSVWVTV